MSTTKKNIGDVVPGEYIVVLKDGSFVQKFQDKVNSVDDRDAKLLTAYKAIPACCASLSTNMVQEFEHDDNVAYIEQVRVVGLTFPDASFVTTGGRLHDYWGLNRVCERKIKEQHPYHYPATGKGITAYVVDTGIYTDHQEFKGRASWGYNAMTNSQNADDDNGHGTHVAGTIGGTTYGVAKDVRIVGVKVLGADGSGTNATVLAGLDWVAKNAVPGKSVVNMSIGGGKDKAIDDAIKKLFLKNTPVVVAADNDEDINSDDQSPSGSPFAYTVASVNWLEQSSRFNSPGKNVDIFAPGERILSACKGRPDAKEYIDGTSMATPHVTGIAAIYLSLKPGTAQTPGLEAIEVYEYLSKNATSGSVSGNLKGMPNFIIYNNPKEIIVA
ncbi:hypothetical protein BG006_006538 [Podila minutissima]|uniref:Peptidase S8/S53 domain-containing protein n=1 Tax=Podila minutissima TaxID=64525 RepID=A0A9P5VLK0_9FUNG|nr:hypothetical protein BG006_006538 [Podila minutissima]